MKSRSNPSLNSPWHLLVPAILLGVLLPGPAQAIHDLMVTHDEIKRDTWFFCQEEPSGTKKFTARVKILGEDAAHDWTVNWREAGADDEASTDLNIRGGMVSEVENQDDVYESKIMFDVPVETTGKFELHVRVQNPNDDDDFQEKMITVWVVGVEISGLEDMVRYSDCLPDNVNIQDVASFQVITRPREFDPKDVVVEIMPGENQEGMDLGEVSEPRITVILSDRRFQYWGYKAPEEDLTDTDPPTTTSITLGVRLLPESNVCTTADVRVFSTYTALAREARSLGTEASRKRIYEFILCKYKDCLRTTGANVREQGGRWEAEGVSASFPDKNLVKCGGVMGFGAVDAVGCTNGSSIRFGKNAVFAGENPFASIIGHELVHTEQNFASFGECDAHCWELRHTNCTGVVAGSSYMGDIRNGVRDSCAGGACP